MMFCSLNLVHSRCPTVLRHQTLSIPKKTTRSATPSRRIPRRTGPVEHRVKLSLSRTTVKQQKHNTLGSPQTTTHRTTDTSPPRRHRTAQRPTPAPPPPCDRGRGTVEPSAAWAVKSPGMEAKALGSVTSRQDRRSVTGPVAGRPSG